MKNNLERETKYNKLMIKNIKNVIKTFSKKQKEGKQKMKEYILNNNSIKNYTLSAFQHYLLENSNYLTTLYQEYNKLRGKKCSNQIIKDDRVLPKIKVHDKFDENTYIIYFDGCDFLIGETLYLTKEGYQLRKTEDFTKELNIKNENIFFESKNENECYKELEKIDSYFNSSNEVIKINKKQNNIKKLNNSYKREKEKLDKNTKKNLKN